MPRHNLSCQLPSKLPADLLSPCLIWARYGGVVPPPPSLGRPLCHPPPGTMRLHPPGRAASGEHRCEPPQGMHGRGCHAWQCTDPRAQARRTHQPPHIQAVQLPPSWSCFQTCCSRSSQKYGWEPIFSYPAGRFLHALGRQLLHSLHGHDIRSASRNRL